MEQIIGKCLKELPLLAEIRGPVSVAQAQISLFGDDEEAAIQAAILWAWNYRRSQRMTQKKAANLCGMSASHFCNMLQGDKYLPPQKINQFEFVVGNTALSQTIAKFAALRVKQMEAA